VVLFFAMCVVLFFAMCVVLFFAMCVVLFFAMCMVLFFAMCMVHISPGFPNKAFPMHETKNNCAGDEKSLLRVCTEPIFHRGSPPSFVYSS